MASLLKEARLLANFMEGMNFHDFQFIPPKPYNHIGALFTDIILQSGLNYSTVVRPRVARVFRLFPYSDTVSKFEEVINEFGINHVLNWKNSIKAERLLLLLKHVKEENIEYEDDFLNYLTDEENKTRFLSLKGIGPKTLDYTLKLLCVDTIAVDRHIFNFISNAGIKNRNYSDVKVIVEYAADLLQSPRIKVDSFIWLTMSKNLKPQYSMF